MIAHLKGKIVKRTEKSIILSVNGVGYLINLSATALSDAQENTEAEFFIHNHIREDMFDLYGFANYEELEFFKKLISINGIGPRLAMEILSVPTEKMKAAIQNENLEYIKSIPGIGPKSAKRIILELKGKLTTDDRDYQDINVDNDAIEALSKLGYSRHQILSTLKNIPDNIKNAEEIIGYFLKNA